MAKRRGMTMALGSSSPGSAFRLSRRRAHAELHRTFDHGERLPLTVDVPPRCPHVLELHQLGIHLLEFLLLPPLPQGPFRRTVDAGVGVVAVEVEQLGDQRLTLAGERALGAVMSPVPGSDARRIEVSGWKRMHPSNLTWRRLLTRLRGPKVSRRRRCLWRRSSFRGLGGVRRPAPNARPCPAAGSSSAATARIDTQGLQPIDDEAAQPRVGTVPQERPDLLSLCPCEPRRPPPGPGARPVDP